MISLIETQDKTIDLQSGSSQGELPSTVAYHDIEIMATPRHERFRSFRPAISIMVFLVPAVFFLIVFLLYPLLSSFQLSLLDWNGLGTGERFVGMANWLRLAQDQLFWKALGNNLKLAFFSVLIQMPIALILAVVLDEASKGSRVLKILYFLPMLMSSVALGVLFKNVYDPNFGPINGFLSAIHLDGWTRDWLGDPRLALGSVIAVVCWQNIPFYMVLFIAGLSSFPKELSEAARLDGASESTIFWRDKAATPAGNDQNRHHACGSRVIALFRPDFYHDRRWPRGCIRVDGNLYVPHRIQLVPAWVWKYRSLGNVPDCHPCGGNYHVAYPSLRNGGLNEFPDYNSVKHDGAWPLVYTYFFTSSWLVLVGCDDTAVHLCTDDQPEVPARIFFQLSLGSSRKTEF